MLKFLKKILKKKKIQPDNPPYLTSPLKYGRSSNWAPLKIWHSETEIGSFCSIAWDVQLGTTFHPTNWLSTHIFQYGKTPLIVGNFEIPDEKLRSFTPVKPVKVGNDVWIGCNVIVLDGVTISDGAIIGAGSVVTKDVPPYAIVGGAPAKIIRYRFSPEIIEDLLELQWWNEPDDIIENLPFNDIESCVKQLKEKKREKIQK